jgi:glycosyl transferase family 2
VTPLIVIPAHDESSTVAAVVRAATAHGPVLVVDDGSSDATAQLAAAAGAEVLRHRRRLGKAQALRTGVAAGRARGATHVLTLDADGQHDPHDIPLLLAAAAPRTIVIGSRLPRGGALAPGRADAIVVAGFFVNWASGLRIGDTQSGFRLYPAALFDEVVTRHGGFVFETEILLEAAARGFAVREVGVASLPRVAARSRFRPVGDGIAIGGYIGTRGVARAGTELAAAAAEVGALFRRERRLARHRAMLEGAAAYADSGASGFAMGAVAARRAAARLGLWWRHPRRRRAGVVLGAALGLPVAAPLLIAAALLGRRLPPATSALVATLYSQDRLHADRPVAATVTADTFATRS